MTAKRILFTGGSGKAGKHVIPYLLERGYRVLNIDLVPLDYPGVDNLIPDCLSRLNNPDCVEVCKNSLAGFADCCCRAGGLVGRLDGGSRGMLGW